jgi:hypothetical protein
MINQIQRRVEHKGQKQNRNSVGDIDEQEIKEETEEKEQLLKINNLFLLEQITNLKIILQETNNQELKDRLAQAMQEYATAQSTLLVRLAGEKD